MVASTMVLVWSLSSLLITHRLLRQEPASTSQEPGDSSSQEADTSHHTQGGRRRQVVRGWWDFRGELLQVRSIFTVSADCKQKKSYLRHLLQVGNIDREGSEGFSAAETELEMRVGVGRHDSSLTNIIYDQVSTVCRYSGSIASSRQLRTMERRY